MCVLTALNSPRSCPRARSSFLSLSNPLPDFLSALAQSSIKPFFVAKVAGWAFRPLSISVDPLLTQEPSWDLLLVLVDAQGVLLPQGLRSMVRAEWTVAAELLTPDSIFQDLLQVAPQEVTPLTGAWNEPITTRREVEHPLTLSLTAEMQEWTRTFAQQEGQGVVSMHNLLAYKDGRKEAYGEYIKGFVKSAGARRGGAGLIFGKVLSCSSTAEGVKEWEDVVIAQYPSIYHFGEMLASEDYQEIDRDHRAGNLKDTLILCTTELKNWDTPLCE